MSNENKTIHEFDFNLICEYFSNVERQGPGSPEATLKALSFIDNLADNSRIADLGCGTGGQTMILAENAPGQITGLDLFPEFINIFNRNAKQSDLSDIKHITIELFVFVIQHLFMALTGYKFLSGFAACMFLQKLILYLAAWRKVMLCPAGFR